MVRSAIAYSRKQIEKIGLPIATVDADGVVECRAVGHQRGGSDNSARVGFDDGAIDARGEAKVVGIDGQTMHRQSSREGARAVYGLHYCRIASVGG